MKKTLFLSIVLFTLAAQPLQALVPGPILLSQEQIEAIRQDQQRQITVPGTRARASCLLIGTAEETFCPGQSRSETEDRLKRLARTEQLNVIPFYHQTEMQALLVLLPAQVSIPAPDFDADPIELSSAPQKLQEIKAQLPGFPVQQAFTDVFKFTHLKDMQDLAVWYYADLHLGLIGRPSEQGAFLLGVFVAK